jgi:hypothetical protein
MDPTDGMTGWQQLLALCAVLIYLWAIWEKEPVTFDCSDCECDCDDEDDDPEYYEIPECPECGSLSISIQRTHTESMVYQSILCQECEFHDYKAITKE